MSTIEDDLQLTGWDRARRILLLRRKEHTQMPLTRHSKEVKIEHLARRTFVADGSAGLATASLRSTPGHKQMGVFETRD